VPDDLSPVVPYGAVDILPEQTESLQGSALLNSVSSQYQLTKDIVRITCTGDERPSLGLCWLRQSV